MPRPPEGTGRAGGRPAGSGRERVCVRVRCDGTVVGRPQERAEPTCTGSESGSGVPGRSTSRSLRPGAAKREASGAINRATRGGIERPREGRGWPRARGPASLPPRGAWVSTRISAFGALQPPIQSSRAARRPPGQVDQQNRRPSRPGAASRSAVERVPPSGSAAEEPGRQCGPSSPVFVDNTARLATPKRSSSSPDGDSDDARRPPLRPGRI